MSDAFERSGPPPSQGSASGPPPRPAGPATRHRAAVGLVAVGAIVGLLAVFVLVLVDPFAPRTLRWWLDPEYGMPSADATQVHALMEWPVCPATEDPGNTDWYVYSVRADGESMSVSVKSREPECDGSAGAYWLTEAHAVFDLGAPLGDRELRDVDRRVTIHGTQ